MWMPGLHSHVSAALGAAVRCLRFSNLVIILDCEANGLMGTSLLPVAQQPRLLEFAAIKGDFLAEGTFGIRQQLAFLVNPGVPIDPYVTKITGITAETVAQAKPFAAHYLSLVRFFLGEEQLIAHNANYDTGVLNAELVRLGKERQFPWPFKHSCTVELTQDLDNKYAKLGMLHERVTGRQQKQTHRAMDDVLMLKEVVEWMRREGRI